MPRRASSLGLVLLALGAGAPADATQEIQRIAEPTLWLGASAALAPSVGIAGAPQDTTKGSEAGAAFVLRDTGQSWAVDQKLLPPAFSATGFHFGAAVALAGDGRAIVGAPWTAFGGSGTGSAYAYEWDGTSWAHVQSLGAPAPQSWDAFGTAIAASGDVAVIGAPGDTGIFQTASNGPGQAFVYRWSGTSWTLEQTLAAADGAAHDFFGGAVAVAGDVVVVGAPRDQDQGFYAGSAYVFRWNGASWTQEQKLLPSDGAAARAFGFAVAVDGDVAVVGAPHVNVPGDANHGAAYFFRRIGGAWVEEQKVDGSGQSYPGSLAQFGSSVATANGVALIGAPTGGANGRGAARLLAWNGSRWAEIQRMTPSAPTAQWFGAAVALAPRRALVGAPNDDGEPDAGAAFVYAAGTECADDWDDDGDGFVDFPADPGCRDAESIEAPACQNGLNDDSAPGIDFDGGASAHGGVPIASPDPQCTSPYRRSEAPSGCGLGAEIAPVLVALARLRRPRGRATR